MVEAVLVEVAQRHVAVVVETAGYYRAVYEHANLIAQGVAENFVFSCEVVLQVWPFEHVVVLDVQILGYTPSVVAFHPRLWLMSGYQIQDGLVHTVVSALVPQAQHDDTSAVG